MVSEEKKTKAREVREGVKHVYQGPITKAQIGHYAKTPRSDVYGLGDQYLRQVGRIDAIQTGLDAVLGLAAAPGVILTPAVQEALQNTESFSERFKEGALKGKQKINGFTEISKSWSQYPTEYTKMAYEKLSPDVQGLKIDRLRARRYRPYIKDVLEAADQVFGKEETDLTTLIDKQKADLEILRDYLNTANPAPANVVQTNNDIEALKTALDQQLTDQKVRLNRLKEAYKENAKRSNLRAKYRVDWYIPGNGGQSICLTDTDVLLPEGAVATRMRSYARLGILSRSITCTLGSGGSITVEKGSKKLFGKDFNRDDIRFMLQFAMGCGKTEITVTGFDAETRFRIYQEALKAGLQVTPDPEDIKNKAKVRKLFKDYGKMRQRYKDQFTTPDQAGGQPAAVPAGRQPAVPGAGVAVLNGPPPPPVAPAPAPAPVPVGGPPAPAPAPVPAAAGAAPAAVPSGPEARNVARSEAGRLAGEAAERLAAAEAAERRAAPAPGGDGP